MVFIYVEIRVARSYIERLFGKRITEKLLASHNCTSLAYYFKESKRVRGICKFENFTLQRAVHPFVPFYTGFRRWADGFFFAVRAILPRSYRESAKAGSARPAAGDAGATCGHGGRRLLPTPSVSVLPFPSFSDVVRVRCIVVRPACKKTTSFSENIK